MQRYSYANIFRLLTVLVSTPALLLASVPPCRATPLPTNSSIVGTIDEVTALATAKADGKPVVVNSLTSETSEVTANPDGSLTMTMSSSPARVKRSDSWVAVETSLISGNDGWLRPQAAAMDVAFAKGAKAGEPLAKLRAPEGMVTLALPFDLPKPEVGGSSLKYPEVLPGIDLQIDMFADSFTEVLVVKNATALKDSRLTQLQVKFAVDSGLQLKMAEDGSSQVLGPDGRVIFSSPVSAMWDSKNSPQAGPKPSARERGQSWHRLNISKTSTRQGSFAASSSGSTILNVAIPHEALENPVFPVFVDPSMSASVGAYSSVWEHGYTEFNQPGQKLKTGNCGWAACVRQGARARSYISMNAAGLSAREGILPTIRSATLNGALAWNAASWSTPVDLYTAGAVHADMRWPGPTGERISTASQSGPGPVEFGGESLRAWVQTCVEHGWERTIGLALVSPNESDRNLWKQFDNAFTLTVNYQYQTGTPIVTIGGVCPTDQTAADLRPTLRAVAANRDVSAGSDVRVNFNIRATDGSLNWSSEWLSSATGSFVWPLPGALSPNRTYEVKAQAVTYENGAPIWSGISPWSSVTTFRTDDGAEPTVKALSGNVTNTSRMKAGDISVSSDNQDVVGFAYGFDGDTLATPVLDGRMCGTFADGFVSGIVPATNSSGSKLGTIPFPWWRSNVHSVKVKAIDAKGRVSEAKVLPIETSDLQTMMQLPLGAATVQNGQVATAADGSMTIQARNGTVVTIPVSIPHGAADPSLWQVRAVLGSQPGAKIIPRIASKPLTAEGPSGGHVPVVWAGASDNLTETFQDLGITGRSFPFELVADCGAQTSCTLNVAGVSLVSRADTPVQLIPDQAVRVGAGQFQALWAPGAKISGVALGALTTNPQMKIEGKDASGRLVQIPVKDFTVDKGRYSFTMPALATANQEAVVTVSADSTAINVVVRQAFSGAGSTRDLWYQSQGRFGWPVAQNSFERGIVVTTADQVNMVIPAPLSVEYAKRNFGQPTKPTSILNGGMYQEFQYGELHSANGISAVPLVNGLRAAFHDKGGFSDLGFATSGEWELWNGACQESFQRADLFWIPWSGTWAVRGGVRNAYLGRWGGPRGLLGLPLTDELAMPQGGIAQNYEHGSFYWSPRTDAQAVFGGIGASYVADGGPRGTLGYPTSEEIRDGNGVFQRFEHGEIRWDGNSARIVRW